MVTSIHSYCATSATDNDSLIMGMIVADLAAVLASLAFLAATAAYLAARERLRSHLQFLQFQVKLNWRGMTNRNILNRDPLDYY